MLNPTMLRNLVWVLPMYTLYNWYWLTCTVVFTLLNNLFQLFLRILLLRNASFKGFFSPPSHNWIHLVLPRLLHCRSQAESLPFGCVCLHAFRPVGVEPDLSGISSLESSANHNVPFLPLCCHLAAFFFSPPSFLSASAISWERSVVWGVCKPDLDLIHNGRVAGKEEVGYFQVQTGNLPSAFFYATAHTQICCVRQRLF